MAVIILIGLGLVLALCPTTVSYTHRDVYKRQSFYSGSGNNRGVAQAKAVLFFILVAAIGLIQLRATRKKEVQQ